MLKMAKGLDLGKIKEKRVIFDKEASEGNEDKITWNLVASCSSHTIHRRLVN